MLSSTLTLLLAASSVLTLPVQKREVPQEHSHEQFLTAVRASLNLDNPDGIVDPVFGLLGNAAASQGQGQITDTDCLHQATADRAFTNAKAAGDVQGQVAALIFRTLERNTGRVGQASVLCTAIQAVNPEIAALSQHQDPASANAAQINKDITLELARQIAAVGGDPLDALKAGTFAPGDVNDPTGKGNSCNVLEDPVGCIFTQNLLVPDATEEEILAAVGGAAPPAEEPAAEAPAAEEPAAEEPAAEEPAAEAPADCPPATVTVTVTAGAEATPSAATTTAAAVQTTAAVVQTTAAQATPTAAPAAGGNLQKFTGALGGLAAPGVRAGGRGFVVDNNSDFLNIGAALNRSCDVQHNQCANKANAERQFSVGDCDAQNTQCKAAI